MIHTTTTPSGYLIEFEDGLEDPETGRSKRRQYRVNGEALPSVTAALGILDKPGLVWGAEKVAVASCIQLAATGELPQSVDGALSRMKARSLRVHQIWGKKAERGTLTHEEQVALGAGEKPRPLSEYPLDVRGFVRGISGWFADERPEVLEAEQMVASLVHGFAGRPDLLAKMPRFGNVPCRIDLKTTDEIPTDKHAQPKPPYPEHQLQLEGYEIAAVESGYGPSALRLVVRVDKAGKFDTSVATYSGAQFLAVLRCYRALRGLPEVPAPQQTLEQAA